MLGPNGAGKTTALRAVAGLQPLDAGRDRPRRRRPRRPRRRHVRSDRRSDPSASSSRTTCCSRGSPPSTTSRSGSEPAAHAKADARAERAGGSSASSSATTPAPSPARSPAARPSASPSPAPSPPTPACCCSTNRSPPSTPAPALSVRTELRRHLATFAGARLLVTHDPVDAIVLADRLVIIEAGRVTQTGAPAAVTARPGDPLRRPARRHQPPARHRRRRRTVRLDTGAELTLADPLPGPRRRHRHPPAGHRPAPPRTRWQRPQHLARHRRRPRSRPRPGPGHPRRAVPVTAEVTPAAVAELELAPGSQVWASVKAVDLAAYER